MKDNLIIIIGMIVVLPFIVSIKYVDYFELDASFIKFLIGLLFVFNVPAIFILINYYFQNKKTTLEIDIQSDYIKICQDGKSNVYKLSDITASIYNIGIYYKNAIDNNARWATIHSDLGYWDIQFDNGDRFYLSNLLVDFLHEEAFVKSTKYRFRLFPYIDKSSKKTGVELKRKQVQEKNRVEEFVEQYQFKNEKQLREILNDRKGYQKEAVEAAEIVLKKKNVG